MNARFMLRHLALRTEDKHTAGQISIPPGLFVRADDNFNYIFVPLKVKYNTRLYTTLRY